MSLSQLYTLKSPIFLKQILDIPRANPRGVQVSNSACQSQAINSIISNQQSIAPAKTPSTFNDEIHINHAKELNNVKKLLVEKAREDSLEGLYMINIVQRLGMEHYFQEEIEEAVRKNYLNLGNHSYGSIDHDDGHKLSEVALQFRLLRQQRCHIDTGVFENFMDKKGRLKKKFWGNIEGLIELFEASQLNMEGEEELDEVGNFTHHLLHRSMWWKELRLDKDLKFAGDKPITWYMWPMACITHPCFSEGRIEITKPISLLYIIDDIFDIYGSVDELILCVDAANRWDLGATEKLPCFMKACFKALYDITNEFAIKVQNKHGWNPIKTSIKSWVRLFNSFLEEAKWFNSGNLPNSEEYLKNGIVRAGVHMCLVHTFFMLGEGVTNETVALMDDFPTMISSTSTIVRLCNDLQGAKDDNKADNDGSYLNCYLKDHP